MNQPRARRAVHGIVLLDKPVGITSNSALQRVRRLFNAAKAGHTGNLDGPASGLLPICLGEATKITSYLLNADKEYISCFRFGSRTSTADAAGEVIETKSIPELTPSVIDAALERFTGEIQQVPPMYSALKHEGERLYRLAAQGINVERKARAVSIRAIERLELTRDVLTVRVRCSKGTYIRTLAEDVAATLGTVAHVSFLRRTQVEPFRIESACTFDELASHAERGQTVLDSCLLPMDQALGHLGAVRLSQPFAEFLRHGRAVRSAEWLNEPAFVRLYDEQGQFMGVGEALADGSVAPRRLINMT